MKISELALLKAENPQGEPVSLVGYFTVTASFSYLTQEADDGSSTKARPEVVLIPGSTLYDICRKLPLPPCGGSLVLYSASGKITGIVKRNTGMSMFAYFLTSITEVVLRHDGSEHRWLRSTEPDGAANRSQPVGPEPNRTPPAAGSGG